MLETAEALSQLRTRLFTILTEEGYGSVRLDQDEDLLFKADGRAYCFLFQKGDPAFLRLLMPNFWEIEDEDERARARVACYEASSACKCASVFLRNDDTWASAETLVTDVASIDARFVRRLVSMVGTAVDEFVRHMRAELQ
jgi:hypothetical protein